MKYFIYTLFLFQVSSSIAQTKGTILEINPYGPDLTVSKMKYGSKVKFKITNVNSFKIEGTNSVGKESISFDVPSQFSQPVGESGLKSAKDVIQVKINSVNDIANLIQSKNESIKEFNKMKSHQGKSFFKFNKNISNLESEIAVLKSKKIELEKEIEILKKLQEQRDTINDLKNEFITNYNCFIKTLNKLTIYTSVDAYIDSLLQETFVPDVTTLQTNLNNYMASINDEDTDINHIRKKCKDALDYLTDCYIHAKIAYDEFSKKIKTEKVTLTGELNTKEKDVKLKIDSAFVTFEREKIFEKEFQFLTEKFDAVNPENKRTKILNKANKGVDYYYKVKNSTFEVFTDAQLLDEDMVTITPKLKNAKGEVVKEYSPVKIKTWGGWKVDFSSGYLLSFRGDENYTNLYDTSGIIGVQKNKTDGLKHAIGAMLNAYLRTGNDFNAGISFGISVPTDGTQIGFYGGLSALMLEKHRLIVSAGIAWNKINLLNTANLMKNADAEKITGKETYKFSNADFKEIKYDKLYRSAFFVGITYNIFTVKK